MRDCNLFDGDVIIIHRHQHDAHQETVVATINQREVALKQLSISRLGIHLWPEDAAMSEVFLHNCDIQVLGMVMGVATTQRKPGTINVIHPAESTICAIESLI